jgi:hypothetical protein
MVVFGRLRKHDRIRRFRCNPGRGVGVLLAHGSRGHEPVAESGRQLRDGILNGGDQPAGAVDIVHCLSPDQRQHGALRESGLTEM